MLHTILQDIKAMIKRPFLLLLLFFGLMVGAFALLSVYTMNSGSKMVANSGFSKDRMIQFNTFYFEDEANKVLELVENDLPEIDYVSVVSHDFADYDVVGILNNRDHIDGNYYGEALTSEDMGQYTAMVSADLREDLPENGEKFSFGGKSFTLKGTFYEGDMGYDAVTFDLRRLPEGTEYVAGMDFSLERDPSVSERANKAIIMPYDAFVELGYSPSVYVLSFAEPLSDESRSQVRMKITEAIGTEDFLDLGDFDTVLSKTQWSKSALYFAATIAGLVNIVVLYAFILEKNRKKYDIYRLLGAKDSFLIRLILLEMLIISVIAYLAGAVLSAALITKTNIIERYLIPGFWEYLLIFMIIYGAEVLISLSTIKKIIRSKSKEKRRITRRKRISKSYSCNHKFLYLMRCQYSGTHIPGVVSIICLSFVVSLVFSYAMTYVFEKNAISRYVDKYTNAEVITVNPYDNHFDSIFSAFLYDETPYDATPENIELLQKLNAAENSNLGIQHEPIYLSNNRDRIRTYNLNYLENIRLPLKKGNYADILSYDYLDESAPIPCLIPESFEAIYPLGTVFSAELHFETGAYVISIEDTQYRTNKEIITRQFEVVGIYSDKAYLTTGGIFINTVNADITLYLASCEEDFIIAPEFTHNGKLNFEVEEPAYFLFTEKGDREAIESAKNLLAGTAELNAFSDCIEAYMESYQSGGGNLYFLYSVIAAVLLLIGSGAFLIIQFSSNMRTFGIYFTCGMPWKTSMKISLTSIVLNMIPFSIIGSVAGVYLSAKIRQSISADTIFLSLACGFALVVIICGVVMGINTLMMKGKSPKTIFGEAQE